MIGRIARPAVRQALYYSEPAVTHVRAYHPPAHFKPPSMDELPVPQGSWQSQYDENQKKYNLHLIAGVSILTATLTYVAKSGILEFNFSVPSLDD